MKKFTKNYLETKDTDELSDILGELCDLRWIERCRRMTDKISSEDFIKAFGGGVKQMENVKPIEITKEEIRDKMFFVNEEDSDQPIAVIKVSDLLEKEVKKMDNEIRLIDANALKEELAKSGYDIVAFGGLFYIIDNAPTVDSVQYTLGYQDGFLEGKKICERPQGEWIDEGQYAEGYSEHAYACKKCGYHIIENPNMIYENRFCKYCGADMRKGGAE